MVIVILLAATVLVQAGRSFRELVWSWWMVMLPFLAFLGHNAVYLPAGFLCFCPNTQ